MVLPLVFLIALTLICLVQFHIASFKMQLDVQEEILFQCDIDGSPYKNLEIEDRLLLSADGAFNGLFEKNYSCRWIKINEGWVIRAGGLGDVLTE